MTQPWTHNSPNAKAYKRVDEHFVEPEWVSERLFAMEKFTGRIYDPCCGFGRIVASARKAKYSAAGADVADRGQKGIGLQDFLRVTWQADNLVFNPPFDIAQLFIEHALEHARFKVAAIFPTARLNAARWLEGHPLRHIWLLTPRPSMPPGHVITAGGKVGGGKTDYCWLVFDQKYGGDPVVRWLHRDGGVQ